MTERTTRAQLDHLVETITQLGTTAGIVTDGLRLIGTHPGDGEPVRYHLETLAGREPFGTRWWIGAGAAWEGMATIRATLLAVLDARGVESYGLNTLAAEA